MSSVLGLAAAKIHEPWLWISVSLAAGEIVVLRINNTLSVCSFINIWVEHMEEVLKALFQARLFSTSELPINHEKSVHWNDRTSKMYSRNSMVCCNKLQVSFSCAGVEAALMQLATAGYRKKTCICRWLRLEGTEMFSGIYHCKESGGGGEQQYSFLAAANFNNLYFSPLKLT